jgi:hypothetical protein
MVLDGDDLFVATGSSLVEIDASTGALVRVVSGPAYRFDNPDAMVLDGHDLFVAEGGDIMRSPRGSSVTELDASTGALVRVVSGPAYRFDGPGAMVLDGDDLFVANGQAPRASLRGGSLTEINASTGALVRVVSGPSYQFHDPDAIVLDGLDLFVGNGASSGGSVTEVNAPTGALVRVVPVHLPPPRIVDTLPTAPGPAPVYQFGGSMVLDGDDLFVTSTYGPVTELNGPVAELNASTGALVRLISGPAYQFHDPGPMVLDGDDLFVANGGGANSDSGGSVTEVNASTGALVKVISAPLYQFHAPGPMVLDSDDLFVANGGGANSDSGGSVTEVNASTGALVKVITGSAYQFHDPDAMVLDGDNLFVANGDGANSDSGGSVTEVNASTGALVKVITGPAYRFDSPDAMVLDGDDLFVADNGYPNPNGNGNGPGSLTELNASTGKLVRVIAGSRYQFYDPEEMVFARDDLFVLDNGDPNGAGLIQGSVTELNASTGRLLRVISGPLYQFGGPAAMVLDGDDLFVANWDNSLIVGPGNPKGTSNGQGSVTELNASTGALVRVVSAPAYRLDGPGAMVLAGDDLVLANDGNSFMIGNAGNASGNSLTELNASTGALVRVVSAPAYRFDGPGAMVVDGEDLFVANASGGSLTELNASTGKLLRVISAPAYRFSGPGAMVLAGDDLFVADASGGSVTELLP